MSVAFLTGFATAFALILAIGAQNAFVLRCGLQRQHVFWVCLFSSLSDAILIAAGVAGFGVLVSQFPLLPRIMMVGGALFLIWYGAMRFWAAWRGDYTLILSGGVQSLSKTLGLLAAFTWLNPHVYLDTLGLIGAVSLQYPPGPEKLAYGIGAVSSSFTFFFGLGYGARLVAPIMQSARAWRILDVAIGGTMWFLAAGLLLDIR